MNAHEKIHQALLQEWTVRIANQTASGLTIREWCMQNNLSIHKYNYWKHIIKENVTDHMLPDIVPVSIPDAFPNQSRELDESRNSRNTPPSSIACNTISITINDISIEIASSDISLLPDIIKAVRYA